MRPASFVWILRGGLVVLVLLATCSCAWLGSVNVWLALLLAGIWTGLSAVALWVLTQSLASDLTSGSYAESCLSSLATGSRALPAAPQLNGSPAHLQTASQAVVGFLVSAENQLTAMKTESDQVRRQVEDHDRCVDDMMGAISDAAMGDLTRRIRVSGDDKLSSLSLAINELISGLSKLVDEVRQAAQQITKSTTDIQSAATQQASGASQQASAITETTATGEELAASAKQIAEHVETVVESAKRANQSARSADGAIQGAVRGMDKIRESSEKIVKTISSLNERSQKIGDIIGIIVDIADQTKLLSLNAAIEAARAGEAGKGFAVVATEIRNLANNVTDSTKEIQELLGEIQKSASACMATTSEGASRVSEGTAAVSSISDALGEIEGAVSHTMQVANQISMSTRQQQSASEQVAVAMREIAQVASQMAKATQETGLATSELLGLATKLQKTVGSVKVSAM
jgi:methyl-accepting chemotaxis protein